MPPGNPLPSGHYRILICTCCTGQSQPLARRCACCQGSRQLVIQAPSRFGMQILQRSLAKTSSRRTRITKRKRWAAAGGQIFS